MKNKLVPYDIAKKLKDLGFNEECLAYHLKNGGLVAVTQNKPYFVTEVNTNFDNEDCTAPFWEDVIKWFEEKHQLVIVVVPYTAKYRTYKIYRLTEIVEIVCLFGRDVNLDGDKSRRYDDNYTARKDAILKAIEIIS